MCGENNITISSELYSEPFTAYVYPILQDMHPRKGHRGKSITITGVAFINCSIVAEFGVAALRSNCKYIDSTRIVCPIPEYKEKDLGKIRKVAVRVAMDGQHFIEGYPPLLFKYIKDNDIDINISFVLSLVLLICAIVVVIFFTTKICITVYCFKKPPENYEAIDLEIITKSDDT